MPCSCLALSGIWCYESSHIVIINYNHLDTKTLNNSFLDICTFGLLFNPSDSLLSQYSQIFPCSVCQFKAAIDGIILGSPDLHTSWAGLLYMVMLVGLPIVIAEKVAFLSQSLLSSEATLV